MSKMKYDPSLPVNGVVKITKLNPLQSMTRREHVIYGVYPDILHQALATNAGLKNPAPVDTVIALASRQAIQAADALFVELNK